MPEVRAWYTYATNVLGYMNPRYKLVLGMARESTCEKLEESDKFLLFPKDTTRHKKKKFKSIYHHLYDQKNEIVLPEDNFLIEACAKIEGSFILKPQDDEDKNFLKAIGPFNPWTLKHILKYASGTSVYQEGMEFGTITVFILRVFKLKDGIIREREARQSVSNQYFDVEINDYEILENSTPIISDDQFHEIKLSIQYIYSFYSALKNYGDLLSK